MATAAQTALLPIMASFQQSPSFNDIFQMSVAASFFQPHKPIQHEDSEEEDDDPPEDCQPEPDDNNNNIEVTIPFRCSKSPDFTPNSTEATLVRKISSALNTDHPHRPPEIVINDGYGSDEDLSYGDYSDDSGQNRVHDVHPESEDEFLSVGHRTLERRTSRSASLEPEELANKINEYDRISTVGTGTFGRVILVQHRDSGAYYALKMMKIREVIRNRQIEHVHHEKNILLSVDHPFIIKLHWAYHDIKFLYMLFDYVPGGELFSYLRCSRRFTTSTARFYTAELTLALEYLHRVHVVYRDLKPENILLDKDGHVRLTDFGFAKLVTEGRTFTMCGTPEYLAPEVVAGKGHNTAVDWWSLGILIYEMMTGKTPFPGDESRVVYNQILETKPKFPKGFDPVAKDLIRRLLVVDRVKRLGNLKGGAEDIKAHKWFSDIDWTDVFDKKLEPPIRPTVNGDGDTGNFDEYDEDNASQCSEATSDDLELFEDW